MSALQKMKVGDFFCAAGGASEGLRKSKHFEIEFAMNHDPDAITWHEKNHPNTKHYNWDVYDADEHELARLHPDVEAFWWSAECTHLSHAKGGDPREARSRMLNFELIRFADAFKNLKIIFIENVKEFQSWGPLIQKHVSTEEDIKKMEKRGYIVDEEGYVWIEPGSAYMIADKSKAGIYHTQWINQLKELGFKYEYRLLNVADYGARTSRLRYWGVASKLEQPIKWPRQTHTANPEPATVFNPEPLKKHLAVRDCLDLTDIGDSIFAPRTRPWSPRTIKRIEYGLNKLFPCPTGEPYVLRYPKDGEDLQGIPECPAPDSGKVDDCMILKYYGNSNHSSPGNPLPTITARENLACAFPQFLMYYYTRDNAISSLERPINTITCDKSYPIITCPMVNLHTFRKNPNKIDEPITTIMPTNTHYLYCPMVLNYHFNNDGHSVDKPLPAIVSKRDKYLCCVQFLEKTYGNKYNVQSLDAPIGTITTIPKFRLVSGILVDWRIVDIRMRMLNVKELKKAQGFPDDYRLPKAAYKAKAFIGNSVPPQFACLLSDCQFGTDEERISGVKDLNTITV